MKNKIFVVLISIIGFAIILFFVINWMKEFLAIDTCLDHGGRWNYEIGECEFCNENIDENSAYYWKSDFDEDHREFLKKGKLLDSIPKTADILVDILNKRNVECSIKFIEIRQDIITILIVNPLYLSEQMGTSGAYCFLGETIFTLTELDSINKVQIEMEVGSHAGPGIYSREDFEELLLKK